MPVREPGPNELCPQLRAASRNIAFSQAAIAPGSAMVRPREDRTCARQNLKPQNRASAREWRSALSEGEKLVATNSERGPRTAASWRHSRIEGRSGGLKKPSVRCGPLDPCLLGESWIRLRCTSISPTVFSCAHEPSAACMQCSKRTDGTCL